MGLHVFICNSISTTLVLLLSLPGGPAGWKINFLLHQPEWLVQHSGHLFLSDTLFFYIRYKKTVAGYINDHQGDVEVYMLYSLDAFRFKTAHPQSTCWIPRVGHFV